MDSNKAKDILQSFVDLVKYGKYENDLKDDVDATEWALHRIEELEHNCLHCEEGAASYCEKCYQDLISQNAMLQKERDYYKQRHLEFNNVFAFTSTEIEKHIPFVD